jgi:hypothetical protein
MKYLTRSIIILLILVLSVSTTYTQEDVLRPKGKPGGYDYTFERNPIIIGFEGGINYNMYSQTLAWDEFYYQEYLGVPNHPTVFDGLESANGISPHFGVMLDIPINNSIGIQARFSYDIKNYGTTSRGSDWAYYIDYGYLEEEIDLEVDATSAYATFTPLLRINANENLFFTVGPTFHFLMGDVETTWTPTVVDQTATLDQFIFWDRDGAESQYTADFKTSSADANEQAFSTRVGLEAGVGYKIPVSTGVYLVPQGRFQYMFTKQMEDTFWYDDLNNSFEYEPEYDIQFQTTTDKMLHSLQFALAIWFEL